MNATATCSQFDSASGSSCVEYSIQFSSSSANALVVRDDGSMIFGLGIIIFFLAILFFGLVFNSVGLKK